MKLHETPVAGAYLIDLVPSADERGFFARLWNRDDFAARGLVGSFVQCNDSFSARRGTLRGLHYQIAPYEEVKLARCISGAVFDVVVDVRPESATYLRWFGAELSAEDRRMLYVPAGCEHGYLTLADDCEVIYATSGVHHPASERGLRWNDPAIGIDWPISEDLTMSAKDRVWPDYQPEAGRVAHS
jgi:dTDP-4-dehydrorhamnose 3,5-epimerase